MSGNAWAQRRELSEHHQQPSLHSMTNVTQTCDALPTKPTAPPKSPTKTQSKEPSDRIAVPKQRGQVQPGSPVGSQARRRQQHESGRSVSTPANTSRELSNEFKDKAVKVAKIFGMSKERLEPIPTSSDKAAKILGGSPRNTNKSLNLPHYRAGSSSATAYDQAPEQLPSSLDDPSISYGNSPPCQIVAPAGPASLRYELEKMGPNTPTIIPAGFAGPSHCTDLSSTDRDITEGVSTTIHVNVQGMMLGDGSISPTRQGTYAHPGNAKLHSHTSIESMRGVVEDGLSELRARPTVDGSQSQSSTNPPRGGIRHITRTPINRPSRVPTPQTSSLHTLRPCAYQPNPPASAEGPQDDHRPRSPPQDTFQGMWDEMHEQHPNSMPPFLSPMNTDFSNHSGMLPSPLHLRQDGRALSASTTQSFPIMFQGHRSEANITAYPNTLRFEQHRPRGPSHGGFAPPPIHPDFITAGGPEDRMAMHIQSIHFHLEDQSRILTRQMVDVKDQALDQLSRRIDPTEDKVMRIADEQGRLATSYGLFVEDYRRLANDFNRFSTYFDFVGNALETKIRVVDSKLDAIVEYLGELKSKNPASRSFTRSDTVHEMPSPTHKEENAELQDSKKDDIEKLLKKALETQMKTLETSILEKVLSTIALMEESLTNSQYSLRESLVESLKENVIKSLKENVTETFKESLKDSLRGDVIDSLKENVIEFLEERMTKAVIGSPAQDRQPSQSHGPVVVVGGTGDSVASIPTPRDMHTPAAMAMGLSVGTPMAAYPTPQGESTTFMAQIPSFPAPTFSASDFSKGAQPLKLQPSRQSLHMSYFQNNSSNQGYGSASYDGPEKYNMPAENTGTASFRASFHSMNRVPSFGGQFDLPQPPGIDCIQGCVERMRIDGAADEEATSAARKSGKGPTWYENAYGQPVTTYQRQQRAATRKMARPTIYMPKDAFNMDKSKGKDAGTATEASKKKPRIKIDAIAGEPNSTPWSRGKGWEKQKPLQKKAGWGEVWQEKAERTARIEVERRGEVASAATSASSANSGAGTNAASQSV